jgi:hypothetical protein
LLEFKKMYANSVRAEFVWNVVENPQGVFDWSKPDHLVATAQELGLRLFVLIGYQYAPDWFTNAWKAVNDQGSNSVVLAYENPYARRAYSNYIAQVPVDTKTARPLRPGSWGTNTQPTICGIPHGVSWVSIPTPSRVSTPFSPPATPMTSRWPTPPGERTIPALTPSPCRKPFRRTAMIRSITT